MTSSLDLTAVQHQFEHWRQTRTHHREPTPLSLRQLAVTLCEHYPISQVVAALKLNHAMITAWRESAVQAGFVPIDVSPSPPLTATQATLMHPNGTQLQLTGLDAQGLQQLIDHFLVTQRGAA